LCAFCYGIPTKTKLTLKVHTLEWKPTDNPLAGNVLRIILFSAMQHFDTHFHTQQKPHPDGLCLRLAIGPYQLDSRSGVALILWMDKSAPSNSSSALRRKPRVNLSTP
jgi:hypothetical protein